MAELDQRIVAAGRPAGEEERVSLQGYRVAVSAWSARSRAFVRFPGTGLSPLPGGELRGLAEDVGLLDDGGGRLGPALRAGPRT